MPYLQYTFLNLTQQSNMYYIKEEVGSAQSLQLQSLQGSLLVLFMREIEPIFETASWMLEVPSGRLAVDEKISINAQKTKLTSS